MTNLYGGIEAGGTKFVCAIGTGPLDLHTTEIATTTPADTLRKVIAFFDGKKNLGSLRAIGIASFGPVDLDPGSPTYGYITSTPKPGWSHTDLRGTIRRAFNVPVGFDTDVNGAALGEFLWGAAQGLPDFIYLTIGTGIGGGGMVNGRLLHGLVHPEMGHVRIPHDWQGDPFPGVCPYHGDCFEGLASGRALEQRWGKPAQELSNDHAAWDLEARYVALGIADLICTLSPRRLVLGGGVMQHSGLLAAVRLKVLQVLNNYVRSEAIQEHIQQYIVAPALGARAGVLGAIALAERSESMSQEN